MMEFLGTGQIPLCRGPLGVQGLLAFVGSSTKAVWETLYRQLPSIQTKRDCWGYWSCWDPLRDSEANSESQYSSWISVKGKLPLGAKACFASKKLYSYGIWAEEGGKGLLLMFSPVVWLNWLSLELPTLLWISLPINKDKTNILCFYKQPVKQTKNSCLQIELSRQVFRI